MKNLFILFTASLTFLACNNKSTIANDNNTTSDSLVSNEKDHSDWNTFFEDFKTAVANNDESALKTMSADTALHYLNEGDNYFFLDDYQTRFTDIKASDAIETSMDFIDYPEVLEVSIHDHSIEEYDGEIYEYESAVYYLFAKIDGIYKFVAIMAAG